MAAAVTVAVIGGGPAGLMAAGTAAQQGASVTLLEKNARLGRKLLLTGKGRCNLTQAEEDPLKFCGAFGKPGKFLLTALRIFGVTDTLDFFNQRGLETKVERGRRVFPAGDQAGSVLEVLSSFVKESGVKLVTGCRVTGLKKQGSRIDRLITERDELKADRYLITTGGLAYPATGSSGDGFDWAERLGHTIVLPRPALVPVKLNEPWVRRVEGLSLRHVSLSVWQAGKKRAERFGEALFTADGLSGPIVLDLSQQIGELFDQGEVELRFDLKPALDFPALDTRLQRDFKAKQNKLFRNALDELLPASLIPVIIELSAIRPDQPVHSITREERQRLLHLLKELPLTVAAIAGYDQAIVTAGGISLKEIDPRTMRSRLIDNLYFAGEIIDLNGPTGGYNLQLCWSTGFLAGTSAAKKE